jgi:hypothetical protein
MIDVRQSQDELHANLNLIVDSYEQPLHHDEPVNAEENEEHEDNEPELEDTHKEETKEEAPEQDMNMFIL